MSMPPCLPRTASAWSSAAWRRRRCRCAPGLGRFIYHNPGAIGITRAKTQAAYRFSACRRLAQSPPLPSALPSPTGGGAGGGGLAERAQPRDRLADDERVDVVGALVGEDRLQVVHVPADGILQRNAVGAQHTTRL